MRGCSCLSVYRWLKAFSAQPVTSNFTLHFYSSLLRPFSLALSVEAGCQTRKERGKKILSEPTKSFCKGLQDYLLLRGPSYTQTSLSFVSGWSLGSEADVLIQSAANSSNALLPPKTHSSHFSDTITSRAALAILLWLYVFTWAGRCLLWKLQPPSCCPLSYRREWAAVRFHLFIIYGSVVLMIFYYIVSSWAWSPWDECLQIQWYSSST